MAEDGFRLTGGCGCGAVRFEVSEPLVSAGYCHCTRCQKRTGGSASLQARTAPGAFRITAGEELLGAWRPEGGYEKVFCSACGSALYSRPPDGAPTASIRFAAFDEDPGIRPTYRMYTDSAATFELIPDDGIARYGGARPAQPPLAGTAWTSTSHADGCPPATLAFDDAWRMTGSSGLNRFFGGYELPGDTIVFGPVGATRMAGPEPVMRQEQALFAVLSGTQAVAVGDGELVIGSGPGAWRFASA